MTKSLLLKGLAGVAAVGGAVGGGIAFQEQIKGVFSSSSSSAGAAKPAAEIREEDEKSNLTQKQLIDKAGLSCGLEGDELANGETKDCSVKEGLTLRVKVGDQTEEEVTFSSASESAKLKVSESRSEEVGGNEGTEVYNKKLKFVVDSGDINLTKKEGGTATTIQKLEQFETYEIEESGDKFYLSRKTKADVGIKNALGLGSFSLPTAGGSDVSTSFGDAKNIKKIRFEGHNEGVNVSGTLGLKVSKVEDTTTYPYGYRFTFTFPGDLTINNKNLKAKIPYEFKIKKGTGNALTLEQAWADDNAFTKKAGLDCGTNKECSVSSESQKLNVKVGEQKKEGITNISGGKIKMETDQAGYNQGLKLTIADGNVTFTTGTGDDIQKLEELETYEITEEGGKYYLTKKTSPDQLIKTSLVLPDGCNLPGETPVECTLDDAKFKAINFDGKGESTSGSGTLTISKANSTDFPFGYKFTFSTTSEATIKTDTKIKAKIPTDFKIKKGSGSGTSVSLSLEKAWDDAKYTLAEKVGLECTAGTDTCCTKTGAGSVKLNVKKGSDKKDGIDSVTLGSGKIKVEKDKEGYNQGLKFTITGGDVSLSGGTGGSFDKLEEFETYEITDEGGKYYLSRKDEASKTIESQLGLPSNCKLSSTSCSLTSDNFKAINFEGKDNASGTATLKISKTDNKTDFPLGYKFTFETTSDATITSTNKIKAKIPTEFKIKKQDGKAVSLEKAWSDFSFAEKAGLTCTTQSGSDKCCTKSSGQLNVEKGFDKKTGITGTSGSGKIKVEKDKEGYNQGLKFTITGGNVTLTGGTISSNGIDFTTLDEYETYEIKESGGKYYLTRKEESIVFIKKQLGIVGFCNDNSWSIAGGSSNVSFNCDIKDVGNLKKIKFNNSSSHNWPTGAVDIQLSIENDSSNGGFKATFSDNNTSKNVCLPTGTSGGSAKIETGGLVYEVKKGTGSGSWCLVKKNGGSSSGQCNVGK